MNCTFKPNAHLLSNILKIALDEMLNQCYNTNLKRLDLIECEVNSQRECEHEHEHGNWVAWNRGGCPTKYATILGNVTESQASYHFQYSGWFSLCWLTLLHSGFERESAKKAELKAHTRCFYEKCSRFQPSLFTSLLNHILKYTREEANAF